MTGATAVRVLIADADRAQREAMCRMLEGVGAAVDSVEDGMGALAIFDAQPASAPDLVILAGTLGRLDAPTTAWALRRKAAFGVAIYAVLQGESRRLERRLREAGCNGFIDRGRLDQLLAIVVRLGRNKATQEQPAPPAPWACSDPEQDQGYEVESMDLTDWLAQQCKTGAGTACHPGAPADRRLGKPVHRPVAASGKRADDEPEPEPEPELDGSAEQMLERVLTRFIDAQLPTILADAIGRAQGAQASSVSATQVLCQMNDQFRERLMGDVTRKLLCAIGETEQQAHAMAACVARQAVADALPSLYRQLRLALCGVGLLGFAVAAGAAYVAARV